MSSVVAGILVAVACMALPWVAWLVVPWVLAVLNLRRIRAPEALPVDSVALGALAPPAQKVCERIGRTLETYGFEPVGYAIEEANAPAGGAGGGEVAHAVWRSAGDAGRDVVQVAVPMFRRAEPSGPQPPPSALMPAVSVVTEFPGQRTARTLAAPLPPVVPLGPDGDVLACPQVEDVRRLIDVHRARPRPAGWGEPVPQDDMSDVAKAIQESHVQLLQQMLAAGLYERDPRDAKHLRLSWRGLKHFATRISPPWRGMLLRRTREESKRALRELGFDEFGNRVAASPQPGGLLA
jgi:hypothetical protein